MLRTGGGREGGKQDWDPGGCPSTAPVSQLANVEWEEWERKNHF